jgi:hypothetical protein
MILSKDINFGAEQIMKTITNIVQKFRYTQSGWTGQNLKTITASPLHIYQLPHKMV